jgi:hypothetical protein
MKPRILVLAAVLTAIATVAALAYQSRRPAITTPKSLTAFLPQDALLTIESPNFAALLTRWQGSQEAKTWLASDDYAVFENSGLFLHLASFQDEFAQAAGVPLGTPFLNQIAGTESAFAWYDIRELQFLYITRMAPGQAAQIQLLQSRSRFERRHAGNADFFLRTTTSEGTTRTVAFAQLSTPSGDLLLLATREDLLANALALLAGNAPVSSVAQEPWFHDASAALPPEKSPPALHMVLNLDRIAVDPHFESRWIQQNISETRQYRAAVSDLYLEPTTFREERALLPKSTPPSANPTDVTALAALAPPETGLARAVATEDPADAIAAIQEKLLGTQPPAKPNPEDAPDPTLETPQTGTQQDLETRIDTPPPAAPAASTQALAQTLQTAHIDALLTLGSALPPTTLWVPIHSAVVLRATSAFNPQTLATALQQALRGSLTTSNLGIEFHSTTVAGHEIYSLTGPHPLFFAVTSTPAQGNLALLADNQPLLLELLNNASTPAPHPAAPATTIATFNHATQRAPYARLTALIDATNTAPAPGAPPQTPAFFSQNIASLSTTFARLQSERLIQTPTPIALRQTVLYQWQPTP